MIHLYPSTKKIFASAMALFAVVIAMAQDGDYATLNKQSAPARHVAVKNDADKSVVKIKARTASKVQITWMPLKGEVSHYVIERSTDSYNFYEAGILFTGESGKEPEYSFTDNLRVNYNGPLHYRLRVVGLDESEYITPVTIINRGGGASLLTH